MSEKGKDTLDLGSQTHSRGDTAGPGDPSPVLRKLPAAVLLLTAVPCLALVLFALWGEITWASAGLALGATLLTCLGVLYPHYRHLDRLFNYIEALKRPRGEAVGLPPAPLGTSPILAPKLDQSLVEAAQERDRRRRELEAAMADTQAILSNLPDPLIMMDRSRRVVRANAAAQALFNRELTGQELSHLLRDPAVLEAADQAIGGTQSQVVDFVVFEDVERHFTARFVPLRTPALDGSVAIISLHDLTALYRAERLRADFVANASHELRTPLTSLVGFIETLRTSAKDDPEAREAFLGIMQDQANRMARLVNDLLSLSRIEMHEHSLPAEENDLCDLLGTVLHGLKMQAEERQVELIQNSEGKALVLGDRDELIQVFQNLVENAIKYGRDNSQVSVYIVLSQQNSDALARRLGRDCYRVSVADQGEGIDREHLPRLTERFYRVDTARSRELGGTGLGLAIVKHIVKRHRGTLDIQSVKGQGTTFSVYLPLARDPS